MRVRNESVSGFVDRKYKTVVEMWMTNLLVIIIHNISLSADPTGKCTSNLIK